MKKVFSIISIFLFFFLAVSIVVLSTTGYETNRFNNLIIKKISKKNNNVNLELEEIKFKIDIKDIGLFLETENPSLSYKNLKVPLEKIKVYMDFTSLIKSQFKINKISILSKQIEIDQLKKIMVKMKPSNITSIINNKISKGNLKTNIELYFEENLKIKDFIAKGDVENMTLNISKNLILKETSLNFFADKSDILIKNIESKMNGLQIENSDLKIEKNENLIIKSNLITDINFNSKNINNYLLFFKDWKSLNHKTNLKAKLNHNLNVTFDKTYKIIDYTIKSSGIVNKLQLNLNKGIKSSFLRKDINVLNFKDTNLKFQYSSNKQGIVESEGSYQINENFFKNFSVKNKFLKENHNFTLKFNLNLPINIDFINYIKNENSDASILLNFKLNKKTINFNQIDYTENKNTIKLEKLKIKNNQIISLSKIKVKTYNKGVLKNDFSLNFGKLVLIKGKKFDATNLNKILSKETKDNFFKNISKNIEIDLESIITPLSKKLSMFKLIGEIKEGKFIKVSSKGDFGNNKFLDIALKSNKNGNKKFLEVYSDLPKMMLSEYKFFRGLSGGVLIFSSVIEENLATSKLVIENFKIVNAPGVVKLLSLADFGGLADLAEGDGLSFEKLEIKMSKSEGLFKLEELYAVGPSISVLMEGYQDKNGLTSLRGTLVPAKNLNKLLSKIPLIGDIIIPKDVGEGLFGVSFKMKGPPGKIKTTINPIKTLTPRFITKALEKSKKN